MQIKKEWVGHAGLIILLLAIIGFKLVGISFLEHVCLLEERSAQTENAAYKTATEPPKSAIPSAAFESTNGKPKTPYSANHKDWKEHFYCETNIAEFGVGWFTFFLFIATGGLWFVTYSLAKDARDGADSQASNMQASITQAARSAAAMEVVATAMAANIELVKKVQENFPKQVRAYVHLDIGAAFYQDDKLLFQATPVLVNAGFTPARNVCHSIKAEILDYPLPLEYRFDEPHFEIESTTSLAPRQALSFNSAPIPRVPAEQVTGIMIGTNRRLWTWGKIKYLDVFGVEQTTEFCVSYYFVSVGSEIKVFGNYHGRHNNAT